MITTKIQLGWKWDKRFMLLAKHIGSWSRHKQGIGCVIVGPDREIRSTGYNGFPRSIEEKKERMESPEKHDWTEHAERNAIYNAARIGVSLRGCCLYVSWLPCIECTRAILQSGISRIVALENSEKSERWKFDKAMRMIGETNCYILKINERDL